MEKQTFPCHRIKRVYRGPPCKKIGDLVHKILSMISSQASPIVDKEKLRPTDSEVYGLISHNRLANGVIGCGPETSLEQGRGKTIAWIRDHLDLYRPDVYEF